MMKFIVLNPISNQFIKGRNEDGRILYTKDSKDAIAHPSKYAAKQYAKRLMPNCRFVVESAPPS